MAEARRKFDEDFKQGAVRLVGETGKPVAQVARELGINEGRLGNWCAQDRRRRHGEGALAESEREELRRLRKENAELRMRCDTCCLPLAACNHAQVAADLRDSRVTDAVRPCRG
jgi:transposase